VLPTSVYPDAHVHVFPSPVYAGALHVQVKLPGVFAHVAFASQPAVCVAHSSMSVHTLPSPFVSV
jgi:hypothetical protein